MFSLLGLESIQPLVQKIAAAAAATLEARVQIVDHGGKAIGECGHGRETAAFTAGGNGLKQAAITLGGRRLGVIKVAPGSGTGRPGRELEEYLSFLSSLLAAKVAAAQAEKRVRELSAALEITGEGVLIVDEAGMVVYGNSAAAGLLGEERREDLAGRPLVELWPDSASLKDLPGAGGAVSRVVPYRRGERLLNIAIRVYRLEKGRGGSRVFSLRDLSEANPLTGPEAGAGYRFTFADVIGRSRIIGEVKERAVRVAAGNSTVLITGESGTGKEVFAQSIHYASPRARGPFVSINCGAIPESLLESELFGYEKGAFTGALKEGKAGKFELADKGTILLDEIGEMSPHLQVKLLHVLQNREVERVGGTKKAPVDVRIIAASNRDLDKMMQEKKFRKDLYFRLGVIPLYIPPLRERKEDIPLFLEHSLKKYARKLNKPPFTASPGVTEKFLQYRWPGNVRELENAIEYAINMCSGNIITVSNLPPRIYGESGATIDGRSTLKLMVQDYERRIFEQYLQRFGSSSKAKNEIAQVLGISRATLYRKLAELGLNE